MFELGLEEFEGLVLLNGGSRGKTAGEVGCAMSALESVRNMCSRLFQEGADEAVFEGGEWLVTHREVKPCRFVDYALEM